MIVVWRVTQRCNLACPFCSFDRTVGGVRAEADAHVVADFGAQLADFQRERGERVLVSWIGGEPFLWPHLRAMTQRFTTEFGLAVSATTNGTTLGAEAVRAHVAAHYAELTVSVDRLGEAHDALRHWPGGFATIKAALIDLAARKRASGSGPLLRINTVLMRDNVEEFPAMCDEFASWGVNEITFNQLGGRDRPEFFPAHRLELASVNSLERQLPERRARLAERGVQLVAGADYLRRFRATAAGEKLAVHDCGAGERFLFIDEAGRVSPCNYTAATLGVPLANVRSGTSPGSLQQLPAYFAAARREQRPEACGDCHCTQVWGKFESPAARAELARAG